MEATGTQFWRELAPGLYRGDINPPARALGALLARFEAEIIIGHPTFHNDRTIGGLLESGIRGAARNFPGQRAAFIVSDGTYTEAGRDESTITAALEAAAAALGRLDDRARKKIIVVAVPYEGYAGERMPGKGSALKLIFEELAFASPRLIILLDGDLRNDVAGWQDVYRRVEEEHRCDHPDREMFITAAYERHFIDASLTRFIVGPLTTLFGRLVRGGISGDIALSAGAAASERGPWSRARRRYGTDIATTLDHLADEKTLIYEVYLGAKLHDITDEAKLTVMPEQVIGSALERILHHRDHVAQVLAGDAPLGYPLVWGAERTGISFTDPGCTDAFDIDAKLDALVQRWPDFRPHVARIAGEEEADRLEHEVASLAELRAADEARVRFLGVDARRWVELLGRGVAYVLATEDIARASRALSYLYTAAFLEFCRDRLADLGLETIQQIRSAQDRLGVPPERAEVFYRRQVNEVVTRLAQDFHASRRRIKELWDGMGAVSSG